MERSHQDANYSEFSEFLKKKIDQWNHESRHTLYNWGNDLVFDPYDLWSDFQIWMRNQEF